MCGKFINQYIFHRKELELKFRLKFATIVMTIYEAFPESSTCVAVSAAVGPTSWTVSDIPGFRVVEISKFTETSQKIHPQPICDRHRAFRFFPQFRQLQLKVSAPLIIMRRRTTIFKQATPFVHVCTRLYAS